VWVDGECWATCQEYAPAVVAAWQKQSGYTTVPKTKDDEGFYEFSEFCREGFREYLRHYVDAIHEYNPNFQVCSNWGFSSFMPEPVTADVDFLSGDYTLQDSINSARWEGRCLARQGLPWDLMAWSFGGVFKSAQKSTKTPVQLKQEAAAVISLGGGFQAYFRQNDDASIQAWQMNVMAEVATFCRDRQPWCHQAELVPQIAVLYPGETFYRMTERVFSPWGGEVGPTRGILQSLLDGQHVVEVCMEHQITGRMDAYPLIVVPEWQWLPPAFRDELAGYARNGGNLLLVGSGSASLFAEELGVTLTALDEPRPTWLEWDGFMSAVGPATHDVTPADKTNTFGELFTSNQPSGPSQPAASVTAFGKGHIAAIYAGLGLSYRQMRTPLQHRFLCDVVARLLPEPMVEVSGCRHVDVVLARKDGRLNVNLVNTAGPHENPRIAVYDDVPPTAALTLTVRCGSSPTSITRQPAGEELPFEYSDGQVRLTVPPVELHDIIVIDGLATD
jgi:hypothetical protein